MDPQDEPQDAAAPPRSFKGCIWGCLGTLVAIAVVITAVFSYNAWYLFKGFANDPRVQIVAAAVKNNDEAVSVLGRNIKVMGVKRQTYDYSTGKGGTATYTLTMVGSNGQGEVKAELDIKGAETKITSLILIDSEHHKHYLVGAPANPLMQNSI